MTPGGEGVGLVRLVGLILVVLGALALGLQGFGLRSPGEGAVWVPPVVSGIAMVGGLLLLATDARRD